MFRLVEQNFWSLNALAVQPGYAFWREAIRHLTERSLSGRRPQLARMRSASCAAAGVILFVVAASIAWLVWPATQWVGSVADLGAPHRLILPTVANTIVVMSAYFAVASLVWGVAGALADQPLDLGPRRRRRPGRGCGGSPICRTCTWSASATGRGSRAAAPARAATDGSCTPSSGSPRSMPTIRSTSCSSPAT